MKRNIQTLLYAFLGFVAFLAVINFAVIKVFKHSQAKDSALVDVSGRNRMLSQQIGLYAEMSVSGKRDADEKLAKAVAVHEQALQVLETGGVLQGFADNTELPAAEGNVLEVLQETRILWKQYKRQTELILAASESGSKSNSAMAEALTELELMAPHMLAQNNRLVKAYVAMNLGKQAKLDWILFMLLGINLAVIGMGLILVRKWVTKSIRSIAEVSQQIAAGHFDQRLEDHQDQYMQQISDAINTLGTNINESARFAAHIGNGEFDIEVQADQEENRLFQELVSMRDKLKLVANEDKQRNWASTGMAEFGKLLRTSEEDLNDWCNELLVYLVNYLDANQGSMYTINDDLDDDPFVELSACYAWNRKKYRKDMIRPGEGLIGQCWLEGETIYMTDVPADYIKIRSGLGNATPSCVLLVPLITNDQFLGVIEIASFQELQSHQIDFINRVAENIASALVSVRTNAQTKHLLEESQMQSEQMQAQEEEMRQNMEEMMATQEEMGRKQTALDSAMLTINSGLIMLNLDENQLVTEVNEFYLKQTGFDRSDVVGKPHEQLLAEASKLDPSGSLHLPYRTKNGDSMTFYSRCVTEQGDAKMVVIGMLQ